MWYGQLLKEEALGESDRLEKERDREQVNLCYSGRQVKQFSTVVSLQTS